MRIPSHEGRRTDEIAWNQRLPLGVASLVPSLACGSLSSITAIAKVPWRFLDSVPGRNEEGGLSWTSRSVPQDLLDPLEPTSCEKAPALAQRPRPLPTWQLKQQSVGRHV